MRKKQKQQSAKVNNYVVNFQTSDEFHHLKREIFTHNSYFFETNNPSPLIIDAGAHIGLSTLYFKYLYPNAQIIAIEPNPDVFELLELNIFENQLEDVQTVNAALWQNNTTLPFFIDKSTNNWFSTASYLEGAWTGDQESEQIKVPTITLGELVTRPIDLLKMDIEGAETTVLQASSDALAFIKHMIIEFHPHRQQSIDDLVKILEPNFDLKFFKDGKQMPLKKIKGLFTIEAVNKNQDF